MSQFNPPSDTELENRYTHHPPKGNQTERYAGIRAKVLDLAKYIRDNTPVSREQTIVFNKLDEAMMIANSAIARNE